MKKLLASGVAVLVLLVAFICNELKTPVRHASAVGPSAGISDTTAIPWTTPPPGKLPPGAAALAPVPVIVPKEMRDPDHLPLRHPAIATSSMSGPRDPLTPPPLTVDPRRGRAP